MLYCDIKADIMDAMRNKDYAKRDCLKNVMGKAKMTVKDSRIDLGSEEIPDDIMLDALNKEVKQLNQTIDALKDHKDTELYKLSVVQIDLLNKYLPKQMTKEEIEKEVIDILSNGEYNSFGQAMKACMAELKGKADSKLIKEAVENYNK